MLSLKLIRHILKSVLIFFIISTQAQTIQTIAGGGVGDGLASSQAILRFPAAIAIDNQDNLFVTDAHNRIRRIDSQSGIITTYVGTGFPLESSAGDGGPANQAGTGYPNNIFVHTNGDLYFTDETNFRLRVVDGTTETINLITTTNETPLAVLVTTNGSILYGESNANTIWSYDPVSGMTTRFAGNGSGGFSGDGGLAINAQIDISGYPNFHMIEDGAGNIYFSDIENHRVRRVDAVTGIITTIAGNGTAGFSGDGGLAVNAAFNNPNGLILDQNGDLLIADMGNHRLRRITLGDGIVTTIAGTGTSGYSGDGGPAMSAQMSFPSSLVMDSQGNIYFTDWFNHVVRRIDAISGLITTIAGGGSTDNQQATHVPLEVPAGISLDQQGNLYIAERGDNRIRFVDQSTGIISTVAGNGSNVFSGDGGLAINAGLNVPGKVQATAGGFYISERNGQRVRYVDNTTGIISTHVGTGLIGFSGDGGVGTSAALFTPIGLALDESNNRLLINDQGNRRIRSFDLSSQVISTIAGNGTFGFSGDGMDALSASFGFNTNDINGLAIDTQGNIFISDGTNDRIRRIDVNTNLVSTVAGNGNISFSGDGGLATAATIWNPAGIALDANNNLYIADNSNNRIRRVDAYTGIITTIAGGSFNQLSESGSASTITILRPTDILIDELGDIVFVDQGLGRVRKITFPEIEIQADGQPILYNEVLDMGEVSTATFVDAIVQITNTRSDQLHVSNVSLSGVGFSIQSPLSSTSLQQGESATMTIRFDPTTVNQFNGTLIIENNDSDEATFVINLTGMGRVPLLSQTISFDPLPDQTYGDAPLTLTASASSGLPVSYTSSNPAIASINADQLTIHSAGSVIITASQSGNATYDPASDVSQTLVINKATLVVTAQDQTKTYGALNPTLTFSYTGFVNGDSAPDVDQAPAVSTSATQFSNAGTYSIIPSGGLDENYQFSYTNGTLTVQKATLTVIADNQTRVYGDANPTFTFAYSGFVGTDGIVDLDIEPSPTTSATAASDVGTYPISFSGGLDNNYNFQFTNGVLTITQASLIVKADDFSRPYGSPNPTFTISYAGFVNGDDETQLDVIPSFFTTAGTSSSSGDYPIIPIGGNDNNYVYSRQSGTLTITRATLTVIADDQSRVYGAANPSLTFSYSGFVNGEDANVLDVAPLPATTASTLSDAGSYPITFMPGSDNNYDFSYVDGTLTISQATLTVRADDQTKVYGAANPSLTFSYSGFVNGEDANVLDVAPLPTTTASALSDAGSYPITFMPGSDNNYDFSYVDGTLTISQATLTVRADDQTKVYGAANPSLTFSYSGFVNGEDANVLDVAPLPTTTASALSDAGSYPITFMPGSDNNYDFSYVDGTLTISQATLTVRADDQSRVYGTANPSLTFSYSGFVNGEDANVLDVAPLPTTTASTLSDAGSYPITFVPGLDNNYDFSYVDGTLTISQATLTVRADDQSRVYGSANPSLTFSYSGFVNGEDANVLDVAPLPTTTASTLSDAGSYPITFVPGLDNNYDFSYVDGTLTISQATLTVRADDQTKEYGAANPSLTFSYSGFVNGEDANVLDVAPLPTTTASALSDAGSYPITFVPGSDNNYDFSYVDGILTITKADQFITFPEIGELNQLSPPVTLNATASSGLPVHYSSSDPTIAALNGNILSISLSGMVTITAFQEGNNNYNAAMPISHVVEITPVLQAIEKSVDVTFYPNPAINYLSIESSGTMQSIKLIDMYGKGHFKVEPHSKVFTLDLTTVASGIYFVLIKCDHHSSMHKISIKK